MLFINPAEEKYGGVFNGIIPLIVPVGVGLVAGYMRHNGVPVRILDEEVTEITPEILREALESLPRPFIIGISCLTAHVVRGYALADMIKREHPDSIVIFGGLHPTALPEEALATGNVDYVVRGEGEEVMLQLYRSLRDGKDPALLRGISFLRDGKVFHNPEAALIPDLDSLPMFPYDLFADVRYDMGFMSTSRGCPMNCTYCSQRMLTGMTYRFKSADKIVEELDLLINRYGQKAIVFYDDNFCFKKRRVIEVCEAIQAAGLHEKCDFTLQTRADNLQEELIPYLKAAGFNSFGFGMETGVDRLATLIDKGETVQQHLDAVSISQKYGVNVQLFMIYGLPTETNEDRETSYRVVKGTGIRSPKFNNLIPYPGTPIYNDLKDGDRIHIEPHWANFNSTLSVTRSIFDKTPLPYVPETTSEFELKRDIIWTNLRSYLTPANVLKILSGRHGGGFYQLDPAWYRKPAEIKRVAKIGFVMITNLIITSLPLAITEPIMNWFNPAMKNRLRIEGYDHESHVVSRWDKENAAEKRVLLKQAKAEHAATGSFSVEIPLPLAPQSAPPANAGAVKN